MIPVGRDSYILLFYTMADFIGFVPTSSKLIFQPGKYQFKVSIYSNEVKPKEYLYDVDIHSWNDFTIQEVIE